MSKQIAKAEKQAQAATSQFQSAIAGLEKSNALLAEAEKFHHNEAMEHATFAAHAQEQQVANNKVLETLRTLVPQESFGNRTDLR